MVSMIAFIVPVTLVSNISLGVRSDRLIEEIYWVAFSRSLLDWLETGIET